MTGIQNSERKPHPNKINVLSFSAGVALLFLFFSSVEAGQEPPSVKTLTFREFYRKVLAYYPKLKQQDVNVNLAITRKLQAVSGYLPSLQAGTSISHGDEPVFVFGSLLREDAFTQENFALSRLNTPRPHTTYSASIEGQLPIFDAFQTISRVRSSRLRVEAARYDEAFTGMEAFLVAAEAYLRAVAADKLISNVTRVSLQSEEDIKQAEDLKGKGVILGTDFYAAKVMAGNINQFKNQIIRERQAARVLMNILMGDEPFKPFTVQEDLTENFAPDKALQTWFEEAYKFRPDLAAVEKTIQAQEVEVSREKSTLLPRIDAFGETRADTHSLSESGGGNYMVGIKAKMDLFDPAYSSRVRLSKETLRKLELDKEILMDSIRNELANEFARYHISRDNLPVILSMLDDAQKAVELMLPLFREGRKSIADLLHSRSSYLNVVKDYYRLLTDARSSWSRLLFLSGQLDEPGLNESVGNK